VSALQILLRDWGGQGAGIVADASGTYSLPVHRNLIVNLREDATATRVLAYAGLGYLPDERVWHPDLDRMRIVRVRSCDDIPDAQCELRVDRRSGLVLVVQSWPREALNEVSFPESLQRLIDNCLKCAEGLSREPPPLLEESVSAELNVEAVMFRA